MMRLANTMFRPPSDKWFYVVPETSVYLESPYSIVALEKNVVHHLELNGIAVPADLRLRIEHYMCECLPPGSCTGGKATDPSLAPIQFFDITANLERVQNDLRPDLIDEREAERRAAVCRVCKLNDHSVCSDCTGLQAKVATAVGRTVAGEKYLGVCRDLRLPSLAVIFLQPAPVPTTPRATTCWRNEANVK